MPLCMDTKNGDLKRFIPRFHLLLCLMMMVVGLLIPVAPVKGDWSPLATVVPSSREFLDSLTEHERAWLRDHPVVTVAYDPEWPPIEFRNTRGEPSGMSIDYLRLVEKRLGIKFSVVKNLSWQEAYARMKRRQIDMTTCVAETPERQKFWAFTNPYMEIPIVIATQTDVTYIGDMKELFGKKVALVEGYAVEEWIRKDYPNIRLVLVKTALEGLEMLQRGEVFAYIDNLLIVGDYQAKMKVFNVKIAGHTPYVHAQRMAVRQDWSILAGILQKALDSISESERRDIYRKWLPVRYEYGFNYKLLWQILAVFSAVLLVLILWILKLSREIRSRKKAEAAVLSSEARFRKLLEVVPLSLAHFDKDGNIVFRNERFIQVFGYTEEEVPTVVEWWRHAYPDPQYRQQVIETWEELVRQAVAEGRAVEPREYKVRCGNGEERIVEISGISLGEEFLTMFIDLTERKKEEERLIESERKLSEAQRMAQLGHWYWDVKTGKVEWSDEVYRIFHLDPEKFTPTIDSVLALSPWPEESNRGQELIAKAMANHEKGTYDQRFLYPDKSIGYYHSTFQGKYDEAGNLVAIIGTAMDITARERAEAEKIQLENQLHQAHKMESVGRLAGGVAHDFNNMLGVILGHAEIAIKRLEPDSPIKAGLEEIRNAASRSADLTRQLLAFARKQTIAPKVMKLNETVNNMLNILQRLIGENIQLEWHPAPELGLINVDPTQIDQILANLCVNARDAIADVGTVTIETANRTFDAEYCAAHAEFTPGEYVLLSVSDTGCGMDAQIVTHIFEPFFTTKETGKGTGLGLATVYGIARQNNGFINVYSEPGMGSTFTVCLPRYFGPIDETIPVAEKEPASRGQENILLVEDEPALLSMAIAMLENLGYTTFPAANPSEALRLVATQQVQIDLLMTDVVMPEMNGRDLAKNLRKTYPQLKCLFMSGYTANVIAHHGVLDEGVYFIQKPFSIKEMAAKIREALNSRSGSV